MSCHESEEASPDPGAVPPVDPPRTAERGRLRAASGSGTGALHSPLAKPERALAKDATDQARQLKRKHRALYTADARRFRRIARAAQSTVFRQKPGPKPDRQVARRIARAARRLAHSARWPELYERFLPGWKELNPVTRADAEDGFRRKSEYASRAPPAAKETRVVTFPVTPLHAQLLL